jgi:hypothetical protein
VVGSSAAAWDDKRWLIEARSVVVIDPRPAGDWIANKDNGVVGLVHANHDQHRMYVLSV